MGFLSKIFKPVKKLFKAVGKVFEKAFKEVKRFASSKLGKTLLILAAGYFGGQALGFFGKGASVASSTVPIVEAVPAFTAGTAVGAETAVAGGVGSAVAGGAAAAQQIATGEAAFTGATATSALTGEVSAAKTASFFSRAVDAAKSTGTYLKEHPVAAIAGGKFLQSLASEDQIDAQLRLERSRQRRSNIGGLNYADPYGTTPLRTAITRQNQSADLTGKTYGNG